MKNTERILIQLDNLDDAYSIYSVDNNMELKTEFVTHIVNQANDLNYTSNIEIDIKLSEKCDDAQKQHLKNDIIRYFKREVDEVKQRQKKFALMACVMLLIGVAIGLVYHFFDGKVFVFELVFEIGAWVFIWETVHIMGFQIPEMRFKNRISKRLAMAKITFVWY